MDLVREPAAYSAIVRFVARNHYVNLMRRPGGTSMVQGGTRDGDIRDCDAVWRIESIRSRHVVQNNCAARSVWGTQVHGTTPTGWPRRMLLSFSLCLCLL
jgi:hypothetical protein